MIKIKSHKLLTLLLAGALSLPACSSPAAQTDSSLTETSSANAVVTEIPDTEVSSEAGSVEETQADAEEAVTVPDSMLIPMDALTLCTWENGIYFDASDPVFFWSALFYALGNNAGISPLMQIEGEELQVPVQLVQEFATGLFADYSDLPEIPSSLSERIRYDAGWEAYFFGLGDRGLSASEILTAESDGNSGLYVTTRLFDVTDDSLICSYRFHLIPNAWIDGITDPLFPYSVESMELVSSENDL